MLVHVGLPRDPQGLRSTTEWPEMTPQATDDPTRFPVNPVARSWAPRPPRGHQAFTKAYSGNPWENKGEPRLLDVPLRYVRGAIRGVRDQEIVSRKSCKNSGTTSKSEKHKFPLNPVAPSGAPGPPRGHQAFTKAYSENPWENKGQRRLLEVPLCYVRAAIRGVPKSVIINRKSCQNSGKTKQI